MGGVSITLYVSSPELRDGFRLNLVLMDLHLNLLFELNFDSRRSDINSTLLKASV